MSRKFSFHKDRMGMLAGLVEEDDYEETRHSLAEEYRKEMNEDVEEVSSTLQEYTSYMGYKPEDSEGEMEADCECPEKARPPEEMGLPGWSYYDADATHSIISTMKDDLQHKKELQWNAPLESELEDDDDVNEAIRARINNMIQEHADITHGVLPNGIGFGPSPKNPTWGTTAKQPSVMGVFYEVGMKEQPDLPGEVEDLGGNDHTHFDVGERVGISPTHQMKKWNPAKGVIVKKNEGDGYGDPSYRVRMDDGTETNTSWSMLFRVGE